MPVSPQDASQEAVSGSFGTFNAANGAQQVLAQNPRRKGFTLYNAETSDAWWYVYLGPGASLAKWSFNLHPGDYYEVPWGYTGVVTVCPSNLTGSLQVEELV